MSRLGHISFPPSLPLPYPLSPSLPTIAMSQHNVDDGRAAHGEAQADLAAELADDADELMHWTDVDDAKKNLRLHWNMNLADTFDKHGCQNPMTTPTSEDGTVSPWWTRARTFGKNYSRAKDAMGLAMMAQSILDATQGEGELLEGARDHVADVLKDARGLVHLLVQIAEDYHVDPDRVTDP